MKPTKRYVCLSWLALACAGLNAATITPQDVGTVCGVAPSSGGFVLFGKTDPAFFSDLSNTSCTGPVVTILADVQFFDDSLIPVSGASVTGISLTQGSSTITLPVDIFPSSVTVNPGDLNLAFRLDIPPAQYSYSLITSGLADGSIVVWNDVEAAAQTSEPGTWLLGMAGIAAMWARWRAARSTESAAFTAWNRRISQFCATSWRDPLPAWWEDR
jgi:hypothetical protein